MHSEYLRLDILVTATPVEVVKTAARRFVKAARRNPAMRTHRKAFYRDMLRHHRRAQRVFLYVATGGY